MTQSDLKDIHRLVKSLHAIAGSGAGALFRGVIEQTRPIAQRALADGLSNDEARETLIVLAPLVSHLARHGHRILVDHLERHLKALGVDIRRSEWPPAIRIVQARAEPADTLARMDADPVRRGN